ncbi:MAG TPA: hypothetical protein VIM42_01100 [Clostridium sp.]
MTILFTVLNFALLVVIIVVICKAIKRFKDFFVKSREVDRKLDDILKKLDNKE